MKFDGKVAVVTGSARGIGRAIALSLAKDGCDIVVSDINLSGWKDFGGEKLEADSVCEEVKKLGRRSIEVVTDVTSRSSVDELFQKALDEFGKVDFVINNAGGYAGDTTKSWASTVSEEDLKATIERNLYGTIFCCQAAAAIMKKTSYGKIVNFGSQAGLRAQAGGFYAPYGAAKAGVINYTKYLAQELGPYKINVNCVAPAYVGTQRLNHIYFDDHYEETCRDIALGYIATPSDIANLVNFLVSEESAYITGQCISICGGSIRF